MLDQIKKMADRFDEIERLVADPGVTSQPARYAALMRERGGLEKFVGRYRELETARRQKADAAALLGEGDEEMRRMAREEIAGLEERERRLTTELEDLMLSSDEVSSRNVILEIRPGTGGEEAALFAGELHRMYSRYAERRGWKADLYELAPTDLGGIKQAILGIEGTDVHRFLRFESGTHRVQRVPKTEAAGRIHTSAATVAVLPQIEEVEIEVRREDLRIDTYSAGGPGGQHVNKTASAVRLTHLPTGIVVACQNERSQIRNRDLAMRWLRARLYEHEQSKRTKEISDLRRSQVGSGDRSEKIRTYNFPQSRVTDHRIGFSVHNLETFLDGKLDDMIEALQKNDREEKLKALGRT